MPAPNLCMRSHALGWRGVLKGPHSREMLSAATQLGVAGQGPLEEPSAWQGGTRLFPRQHLYDSTATSHLTWFPGHGPLEGQASSLFVSEFPPSPTSLSF